MTSPSDTKETPAKRARKVGRSKALHQNLLRAHNEKDVENAYRQEIARHFPTATTSPLKVDGLLECEDVRSLLEFKFQTDLKIKLEQCNILIQCLYYIKQFESKGEKLPTTIFVGDRNECFAIQTAAILKYLKREIDWKVAASAAHKSNPAVIRAMVDDQDILPFVWDVTERFDFSEVIEKIKALGAGVVHQIKITRTSIVSIFLYWRDNVLRDRAYTDKLMFQPDILDQVRRQADVFFNCLTDRDSTYLHPQKKGVLVTRGEEVKVHSARHLAFFAHFKQQYSPRELEMLVGSKDRILDEVFRRRTGAFFTPTQWVNEAHKMIAEQFGEDWKDKYVVWDCASGTNNLTRDTHFAEMYSSTLDEGDVNTVKDMGYNPGSTVFQYDFLNDDEVDVLGPKVPQGLREAFEQKRPFLFLINPPYGTSSDLRMGKSKKGLANTRLHAAMKEEKLGDAVKQLYAQFFWRILRLIEKYDHDDVTLASFSTVNFITGQKFKSFRKALNQKMSFASGMMFNAKHFADVESWPIVFTVWKPGVQQGDIVVDVKDLDETFSVETKHRKILYNLDETEALNTWARKSTRGLKLLDCPQLGSACVVKQKGYDKLAAGALGYIYTCKNTPQGNGQQVAIFSSVCSASNSNGYSILPDNMMRTAALFTARRSVEANWINWQDEYKPPNDCDAYARWNQDALVYSIFNTKSNQSSLRNVTYKDKAWDIRNQFFFMGRDEMADLADAQGFHEMYQDTKASPGEAYVHTLLETTPLSDDARAVLEAGRELVRRSMAMRDTFHAANEKYHLQAWDAGWSQLKPLFNDYFKEEHKAFVVLYKAFENRLREGVYTFGFLRR